MLYQNRFIVFFIAIALVLASCSFTDNARLTADTALATPTINPPQVNLTLEVPVDTSIQYNIVGQLVKYKFIVTVVQNSSTGIPANLSITGAPAICPAITTVGNLDDRLDVGEKIECTFDYPITQADLDRGSISTSFTANAYTVNSNTVTTNVPTVQPKALTLTKTANPTTYGVANQQITFSYTVKNSGTQPLGPNQFTVTDSGINNNQPFNCGSADATITPGATLTCNSTYLVTTADMNAASITHTAIVSGGGVTSQPVSLSLTKGQAPPTATTGNVQHTVREGEWLWQIARCYSADPEQTVKANPQVVDPKMLKVGTVVTVPNIGTVGNKQVHAPPELCVQFHTVQSGDTWTSIAQKYGADPGLTQYVNNNSMITGKQVKVPLYTVGLNIPLVGSNNPTSPTTSGISLTVTPSSTVYSQADQLITFNYTIKNNGATTLGPTQFVINDALMNPTGFNCGASNSTIAAGSTLTCSNTYKISQTDMGAVSIQFSTTASALSIPASPAVATTLTKGVAQITLTVSPSITTYNQAGQTITFSYTIKNTGSTTLGPTQFVINDALMSPTTLNCGAANTTLAPGGTVQCTNNYTVTQADMGVVNIQFSTNAGGVGVPTSANAPTTLTKQ